MAAPYAPSVLFQPIVDLSTGQVIGYEALGRVAGREDEGFSAVRAVARPKREMDRVLLELPRLALTRGAIRPPGTLLFINITKDMLDPFLDASFPDGATFEDIVLEVPESDKTVLRWSQYLAPARERGIHIAVDDWGVGQADPLRVAELRPDWVKIDIALIRKVGRDPAVDRLVSLIVNWLSETRARVIAEGVETSAQILRLRQLGVRYGQGFGLARPVPFFPEKVEVPLPSHRIGQVAGLPLALQEAYDVSDEHLALIDKRRAALLPVMEESIEDLARWIHRSKISPNLEAISSVPHFCSLLLKHFTALTRGYLGSEDIERASRIVKTHRRFDIDMAWYVVGYRRFQRALVSRLESAGEQALADAMRELLTWDMGMVLSAYRQDLERDPYTELLNPRTFFDQASLDAELRVRQNQRAMLLLVHIGGLDLMRAQGQRTHARSLWRQIGHLLGQYQTARTFMGVLDGDDFGIWTAAMDRYALDRLIRRIRRDIRDIAPDLTVFVARASLGRHGTTVSALYDRADRRLSEELAGSWFAEDDDDDNTGS